MAGQSTQCCTHSAREGSAIVAAPVVVQAMKGGGRIATALHCSGQIGRSELHAERDRDELQVRSFVLVAEHHVVARLEEGADSPEREADAATDVHAGRRSAVGGTGGVRAEAAVVDTEAADEIGCGSGGTEVEHGVRGRRSDASRRAAADSTGEAAFAIEAAEASLDARADGNDRRSEREAEVDVVAGIDVVT